MLRRLARPDTTVAATAARARGPSTPLHSGLSTSLFGTAQGRSAVLHYSSGSALELNPSSSSQGKAQSSRNKKHNRRIVLRDARQSDSQFLARVILMAARSHLTKGVFDIYFPDEDQIAVLTDMTACSPDAGSACCWADFIIAEVDGVPAAALAGYGTETKTTAGYLGTMRDALMKRGWTQERFDKMLVTREAINSVTPWDDRKRWVVDWVSALPEFQRLGLISRLLREVIQRGKDRGYKLAEVTIFIGNEPALRAYKKVGFEEYQSIISPVWQRYIDCPGHMRLLMPLDRDITPSRKRRSEPRDQQQQQRPSML